MESLEDIDLVRALNFSSSLKFLCLVEEELAGLVLATSRTNGDAGCRILFPPLKPRYASLLQVAAARFGLRVTPHGWGDERRLSVGALRQAALPRVQCADFRPLGAGGALAGRLAELAKPSEPRKAGGSEAANPTVAAMTDAPETLNSAENLRDDDRQCERNKGKAGGLRGWSDDEESGGDADGLAKRRRASAAAGRAARGRGFAAGGEEADAKGQEDAVRLELQKDYTKYAIDPNDTWRPHRKPYTELEGGWEFSGAWSFDPDENEQFEEGDGHTRKGFRGVAAWRVEHAKGGDFSVAFADGTSSDARSWLEDRASKRGEEPFVLEFRLDVPGKQWEYRFGRASKRQGWRRLPWSNAHRTSFWAATLPGEDGKQHLLAGLDEFPERRFLFAKARMRHRIFGFGPPAEPVAGRPAFYVRDVVVFGRLSLLPPPFASRDHFVELPGRSRQAALELLAAAACAERVAAVLELPPAGASLLVCRGAEDARETAAALEGALAVRSSEWTWPPEACDEGGVAAAQAHRAASQECWGRLSLETTRELAIFEEHLQRRTKHLEGVRVARASATRMILGNLRGDAPLPKPPRAGV